ncbi:REP-associated tyrosine transposase [Tundrisphaera lichenicola]|uniref:REP-associated tyrosine transposase n=1 Tax=Tundrisphaera lichenicola TaxID=2029860 RepID=UPI003EBBFB9E
MEPLREGESELPRSGLPWPRAPLHELDDAGTFMVTAGTYRKEPLFSDGPKLRMLHAALLTVADRHEWRLEAWAVFPNHYHFVAASPGDPATLKAFLRELHSRTAIALNRRDQAPSRKVWRNYWDTRLTHQRSYLARLHYVHQNPVKHGIVSATNLYPHGSAAWFERAASPAQVRSVYSFPIDRLNVDDDF